MPGPEATIQKKIVDWLRSEGFLVFVSSWNRKLPKQWRDLPDVIAWGRDHCLLIEVKSLTGQRRQGQIEFWLKLREALWPGAPHVIYIVARCLEVVQDEVNRIKDD